MSVDPEPLVSVIVPIYNVEDYLDGCLHSVRSQSYCHLEVILVEDCCTDGSLRVLEKHLSDDRVRLIRHTENAGLSAARNSGIEAARGDYLLFVDSDDLVESDLVEACVECALENDADLVLFDFVPFWDGGEAQPRRSTTHPLPTPLQARDPRYFALPQFAWLKFIRTAVVREHDMCFPVGYYYEDGPFHWGLGLHAGSVFHLNQSYYYYRQRGTSITGSGGRKLFDQFAIQRMIAKDLVRNGPMSGVTEQLASQVYRSIWFISSNIVDELLGETLDEIRNHLRATEQFRRSLRPDAKTALVLLIAKLPRPLALASIRALRAAVRKISPARRSTHRMRHMDRTSTKMALS